ncbi:MAG: ABC transporter ATP-binding protein/permease [Alkalibacterium thalassium]|nr:ABC transporter ATP-binding protein/permease [Alkalibacterium thalassium]
MQDETASFSGKIQQTIAEIRLMKSSTAEGYEQLKGEKDIEKLYTIGLKEGKYMAIISPLIYTLMMGVMVFVIGYGGVRVARGQMTTGQLVAFLLYLFQIIFPIITFMNFFMQMQKAAGATDRISSILEEKEEAEEQGEDRTIVDLPIIFDQVSFSYEPEKEVLKSISFEALPGEKVAFAGPSGGGKSTLFALLERFYTPDSGEIRAGEVSIETISLSSWRSQIGYVSQENAMMSGTIRSNVCYGLPDADSISDERLWEVLEMAYAKEFVEQFPGKLDEPVGERGLKLSGGQRQRINIARAFLRDPNILMMDEATASLDSQSEEKVSSALKNLMKGRTTFVIAHRLSTIVDADKILFIENGQLTGIGKHEELMKTHPLYKSFAHQQLADE